MFYTFHNNNDNTINNNNDNTINNNKNDNKLIEQFQRRQNLFKLKIITTPPSFYIRFTNSKN